LISLSGSAQGSCLRVWVPKATNLEAPLVDSDIANKLEDPMVTDDVTLVPTSATTYSSWADEVEAADLLEKETEPQQWKKIRLEMKSW
jgi:hypothetical protein